jgi:hypothetical protein
MTYYLHMTYIPFKLQWAKKGGKCHNRYVNAQFTCDDMVQHNTKDGKVGMVSVNTQQNLKNNTVKRMLLLRMLQSNIQPQLIGHSNISSPTVQYGQVFSHPRDNKVGNVICIHGVHPTAEVNLRMLFSHNFNQSVMSLTSYS